MNEMYRQLERDMDKDSGISVHKRVKGSKGENYPCLLNQDPFLISFKIILTMNFPLVVECSRAQSLNSCKRVGVRVTSHGY